MYISIFIALKEGRKRMRISPFFFMIMAVWIRSKWEARERQKCMRGVGVKRIKAYFGLFLQIRGGGGINSKVVGNCSNIKNIPLLNRRLMIWERTVWSTPPRPACPASWSGPTPSSSPRWSSTLHRLSRQDIQYTSINIKYLLAEIWIRSIISSLYFD